MTRRGGDIIEGDTIRHGVISCTECDCEYLVINYVAVFFEQSKYNDYLNQSEKEICRQLGFRYDLASSAADDDARVLKATQNWSYQWNEVYNYSTQELSSEGFFSREKFEKFIRISPTDYEGKTVVVWCGGKGREAYHISGNDPALLVVNEIGDEIYGVRQLLPKEQKCLLIRCDMLHNPLKGEIADISICDHALQHIADHKAGFARVAEVVKPGGTVAVCVYSYENNFLMTHIIEPMKCLLHLFPLPVQRIISLFPALMIYLSIHLFFVPLRSLLPLKLCRKIPYFDHMIFWSKDDFNFIWMACFDLIHAPISYHFRRNEVEELAHDARLTTTVLENTHTTTWSLVSQKCQAGAVTTSCAE